MSNIFYPDANSIAKYDTFAVFPSSANHGDFAVALDTNILYEFNGTIWISVATPGGSAVDSVTGWNVDNTDPANPIIDDLVTDFTLSGIGTAADPLHVVGVDDGVLTAKVATTAALANTPTYSNGASGVGATLTRTGNGAFPTTDSIAIILNDIVLVKNQVAQLQNGLYQVTTLGSAGAPWVLTRTTSADTTTELDDQIVAINSGSTNGGKLFGQQTETPTVGTSNIVYAETSSGGVKQKASGTQVLGQIPWWTGTPKQLDKGTQNLTWIETTRTFTANSTLLQVGDYTESSNGSFLIINDAQPTAWLKGGLEAQLILDCDPSRLWSVLGDPSNIYLKIDNANTRFHLYDSSTNWLEYSRSAQTIQMGDVNSATSGVRFSADAANGYCYIGNTGTFAEGNHFLLGSTTFNTLSLGVPGKDNYLRIGGTDAEDLTFFSSGDSADHFQILGSIKYYAIGFDGLPNNSVLQIDSTNNTINLICDSTGANQQIMQMSSFDNYTSIGGTSNIFLDSGFEGIFLATNNVTRVGVQNTFTSLEAYGTSPGETYELQFKALPTVGGYYIGFKAPDSRTSSTNLILKLPPNDPTAGQVMAFTAPVSGVSTGSWITPLSSGTAWLLDGNTNGSEKYLGTDDNFRLPFRVNNVETFSLETNGSITRYGIVWSRETAGAGAELTTWGYNAGGSVASTGSQSVMVGYGAGANLIAGNGFTAVGANALIVATVASNTALGGGAGLFHTTGNDSVYVGFRAGEDNVTGDFVTTLGSHAYAGGTGFSSILSLSSDGGTANNQIVIGGARNYNTTGESSFTDMYIGRGVTHATPGPITIHATSGLGTNIAGGNLNFAIGQGTGTGLPGDYIFYKAPAGSTGASLNALSETFRISGTSGAITRDSALYSVAAATTTTTWGNLAGAASNGLNTSSVYIGYGAGIASTASSTIVISGDTNNFGFAATYGNSTIAIGSGTLVSSTAGFNVGIGGGAGQFTTTGSGNVYLGYNADFSPTFGNATGSNNFVFGQYGYVGGSFDCVFSAQGLPTASNQIVFGGGNAAGFYSAGYFGNGVVNSTPQNFALNATGGSGTDKAGASFTIAGGKGTGNAVGGTVFIATSLAGSTGTTLQTLSNVVGFDSNGNIRAFRLHNNATAQGTAVQQDIRSGTYTPAAGNNINLDSTPTPRKAQWLRVGNVVTVSGIVDAVDPTSSAGTLTSFTLTFPIDTAFTDIADAAGVASTSSNTSQCGKIYADVTNQVIRIEWRNADTNSQSWSYHYTYEIIAP